MRNNYQSFQDPVNLAQKPTSFKSRGETDIIEPMTDSELIDWLKEVREQTGTPLTVGISDAAIVAALKNNDYLASAIELHRVRFPEVIKEFPELKTTPEADLIPIAQKGFLNFYPPETVSPYLPMAAKGPWIISCYGAVIYDTGGYGMLGLGHDPVDIRSLLSRPSTMANIMTPNFSQRRFVDKLNEKIGINHSSGRSPYQQVVCINSGSEACAVAARISNAHAKVMTDPGGKHAGESIRLMSLKGSFHGRTLRPAQASDSTRNAYKALAEFRDYDELLTVTPNDIDDLERVFAYTRDNNIYVEAMFMEPVMGEGNPGLAITPEFYAAVRRLTREHDAFLIIDSIQAGLRVQGVLSIFDYPGFEDVEPPEMEAFSKALNAGQFPLSVLALSSAAAKSYVSGIYGNTMTANPRGLDIACAVLDAVHTDITLNIRERGIEFVEKLKVLQKELPDLITAVQGTGLLVSAAINPEYPVIGIDGIETRLRKNGINVIHGGKNALRFTPFFMINSADIDLIVDSIRSVLVQLNSKSH